MVLEGILNSSALSGSDKNEHYKVECNSTTSSSEEDEEEEENTLVIQRDGELVPPSFGNISVENSSEVHFGNKTFYQGPVTIKQFLYANGQSASEGGSVKYAISDEIKLDPTQLDNGIDNPAFKEDFLDKVAKFKEGYDKEEPPSYSQVTRGIRCIRNYSQQHIFVVVAVLAILMVSLTILMVIFLVKNSPPNATSKHAEQYVVREDTDEQSISKPVDAPLDPQVNLTLPNKLKIVSRLEWVAQPAVEDANKLNVPVPYVIIMHTATANCSSRAQCNFHVRYIQMFHIESNNWWDIGYNFLVGGDGSAYEGRGWTAEGAHTYGYNARSIGMAFIGTFTKFKPPEIQMTACKQLIAKGVELGYVSKSYKLLAARQLQTTESPGLKLYEEIKKWPHWSPSP